MIVTEHSRTTTCSAGNDLVSGVSSSCQSAAAMYFAGFVCVGIGVMVIAFSLLMKRHEGRVRRRQHSPTEFEMGMRRIDAQQSTES
jgi:hypothetical protein